MAEQQPSQCGTPGGYQAHRRRGEEACPRCKRANRDYMRGYRATDSNRDTDREARRTRWRAMQRLTALHAREFQQLLAEERRPVTDADDTRWALLVAAPAWALHLLLWPAWTLMHLTSRADFDSSLDFIETCVFVPASSSELAAGEVVA